MTNYRCCQKHMISWDDGTTCDICDLERQLAEFQNHEKQTHDDLSAILGTDTSLLEGAKRLHAENTRLRDGLRKLQFVPDENSCADAGTDHEYTDYDDEHHRSCVGCGRFQCQGCEPDCWLAALLKEAK